MMPPPLRRHFIFFELATPDAAAAISFIFEFIFAAIDLFSRCRHYADDDYC